MEDELQPAPANKYPALALFTRPPGAQNKTSHMHALHSSSSSLRTTAHTLTGGGGGVCVSPLDRTGVSSVRNRLLKERHAFAVAKAIPKSGKGYFQKARPVLCQ
jgi:hypothetical protein